MKSTETSPSAHVPKKWPPEEFDLVILGGGTGSTIAAWTFAGEGKRAAFARELAAVGNRDRHVRAAGGRLRSRGRHSLRPLRSASQLGSRSEPENCHERRSARVLLQPGGLRHRHGRTRSHSSIAHNSAIRLLIRVMLQTSSKRTSTSAQPS